jgi:hypothetical protein
MMSPKLDPGVRALLEFVKAQADPSLESMSPSKRVLSRRRARRR